MDIMKNSWEKKKLCIIGNIDCKISMKKELEASKRNEIRSKTEEAEKSRLARQSVMLKEAPTKGKKGPISKRTPSVDFSGDYQKRDKNKS